MTTLAQMAAMASAALDDAGNAYWSAAQMMEWVKQGLRDYSIHFARSDTTTINCTTGTQTYNLPADFLDMLSCEYPTGEDPVEYLTRKSRMHPDFWSTASLYDVQHYDQIVPPVLYVSDDVATGETITIIYTTAFDESISLTLDTIDIPGHHEHLIILFCTWQATNHRLGKELQGPDTTIQLVNQIKAAAWEARDSYHQAIREAEKRSTVSGPTGPWKIDEFDRIY